MNAYPPQLYTLVINNIGIATNISSLLGRLDEDLDMALTRKLENLVAGQPGWQCKFDVFDMCWAPEDWPKNEAGRPSVFSGRPLAFYCLDGGPEGNILQDEYGIPSPVRCLSVALGHASHELRFCFNVEEHNFINKIKMAPQRKSYNEAKMNVLRELYDRQPLLRETGFHIDGTFGLIYRPFVLSAEALAENYPDFEPAFQALEDAWKDLLKVHHVFDEFVKEELPIQFRSK